MANIVDYLEGDLFNRFCALIPSERELGPDVWERTFGQLIEKAVALYLTVHEKNKSWNQWILREFSDKGMDTTLRHEFEFIEEFAAFLVQNFELFKRANKGNVFVLVKK